VASNRVPKITLEEYQQVVQDTYDDWADFLGVQQQWSIELTYKRSKDMEDAGSLAETNWPYNYRSAVIRFNIDQLLKKQPAMREIREATVHELGHLVAADLWDLICANFQGGTRKMLLDLCEKEIDTWTHIVIRARGVDDSEVDDGVVSLSDSQTRAEREVWL